MDFVLRTIRSLCNGSLPASTPCLPLWPPGRCIRGTRGTFSTLTRCLPLHTCRRCAWAFAHRWWWYPPPPLRADAVAHALPSALYGTLPFRTHLARAVRLLTLRGATRCTYAPGMPCAILCLELPPKRMPASQRAYQLLSATLQPLSHRHEELLPRRRGTSSALVIVVYPLCGLYLPITSFYTLAPPTALPPATPPRHHSDHAPSFALLARDDVWWDGITDESGSVGSTQNGRICIPARALYYLDCARCVLPADIA